MTTKKSKTAVTKGKVGRPSTFSADVAMVVCTRIAKGESLNKICKDGVASIWTVLGWLDQHPEFAQQYARARELQADYYADEICEIADAAADEVDPAAVQAAKLRVDARKWVASKLKPKRYGDRIEVESKSEVLVKDERESLRDKVLAAAEGPIIEVEPQAVH
jgi:hypothetical protein